MGPGPGGLLPSPTPGQAVKRTSWFPHPDCERLPLLDSCTGHWLGVSQGLRQHSKEQAWLSFSPGQTVPHALLKCPLAPPYSGFGPHLASSQSHPCISHQAPGEPEGGQNRCPEKSVPGPPALAAVWEGWMVTWQLFPLILDRWWFPGEALPCHLQRHLQTQSTGRMR